MPATRQQLLVDLTHMREELENELRTALDATHRTTQFTDQDLADIGGPIRRAQRRVDQVFTLVQLIQKYYRPT